jgi:MFS family permease
VEARPPANPLALSALLNKFLGPNIGNAKIDGLQEDLNLTNNEYNDSLTIFFISYSLFEPLTQILLKRFKPSRFLPTIMVLWGEACHATLSSQARRADRVFILGICMTTMGLVHNFSGLLAARWFLGLTEAGLFPGTSRLCRSRNPLTDFQA